jgi:hypothetical protein
VADAMSAPNVEADQVAVACQRREMLRAALAWAAQKT